MSVGIRLTVGLLLLPSALAAQGFLEQFSYEGLRFSGIGIELGAIASDRVETAFTPAVRVDYGHIAPRVRVLLGASYFKSDFNADEVAEFETRLRGIVSDPTNDFTVDVGTITWSDLEADLDLQYLLGSGSKLAGFLGVGLAVHVRNGSGAAIDDTFVEDALDTIEAGFNVSLGTRIELIQSLHLTVDLRGGMTSELRSAGVRAGLMYRVRP